MGWKLQGNLYMPDQQGFGGGRAGSATDNTYILDKPYDLQGATEESIQQIDEMLALLFRQVKRTQATAAGAGTGNVTGPASAGLSNVAVFGDTTGKLLSDGGALSTLLAAVGIVVGTLKLNTAQIDALNATPQTLIAAQGGNKQLFLLGAGVLTTRSGAWSASSLLRFQYNGSTTRLLTADLGTLLASAGAGSATSVAPAMNGTTIGSGFTNTAIEVQMATDTNPGAQTATMWIVGVAAVVDAS